MPLKYHSLNKTRERAITAGGENQPNLLWIEKTHNNKLRWNWPGLKERREISTSRLPSDSPASERAQESVPNHDAITTMLQPSGLNFGCSQYNTPIRYVPMYTTLLILSSVHIVRKYRRTHTLLGKLYLSRVFTCIQVTGCLQVAWPHLRT